MYLWSLVCRLDGLKAGPIEIGAYSGDWLDVAKPAVEARMSRYASSETSFALLSVRPTRSVMLEAELEELHARLESLSLSGIAEDSSDAESLRVEIMNVKTKLDDELARRERDRQENIRRRHNYVPFIMCLLKHLSKKGKLAQLVDSANQRSNPTGGAKAK